MLLNTQFHPWHYYANTKNGQARTHQKLTSGAQQQRRDDHDTMTVPQHLLLPQLPDNDQRWLARYCMIWCFLNYTYRAIISSFIVKMTTVPPIETNVVRKVRMLNVVSTTTSLNTQRQKLCYWMISCFIVSILTEWFFRLLQEKQRRRQHDKTKGTRLANMRMTPCKHADDMSSMMPKTHRYRFNI